MILRSNYNYFFDYIILVTADKELRLKRAIKRKTLNLSQIKKRMALQLSDSEKINSSDYTINNNTTKEDFKKNFQSILRKILSVD